MSDYRLRAAVTRLLDAVRTEPTMGGQLRNHGIADRKAFAAAYDELRALLASPPSATAATCARGCDGYDRAGLPCEYPDCARASVATQSEANKELVREARRIGRGNSGADPALAGVRIRTPAETPNAEPCATCGEVGGNGKVPNPNFATGGPAGLPCPACGSGRRAKT